MAIGYKLFEMDTEGNLHPLFIGKNEITPIGEWVHAQFLPTKGFASRGGWHIGADFPSAPWLMSVDGTYKSQRSSKWHRVWCEIEYNTNHDYNEEVAQLPKKCFVDSVPNDGFYFFREVGKGTWVITSDIKINRVLTETERQQILKDKEFDEMEQFEPYRNAMLKRLKRA